jgi:Flp pilus assembly protein TadD
MGRFDWLELEKELSQQQAGYRFPQEFNDAYFLSEGKKAHERGQFEQALRLYSRCLSQNPKQEEAWRWQVVALVDLQETDEALLWIDKGLELFPQHPLLLATKAFALGRKRQLGEALRLSDISLQKGTVHWWIWCARGDVLLQERAHSARFCLDKASELCNGDSFARLRLAMSAIAGGEPVLALDYLRSLREQSSRNPWYWYLLGVASERLGEREKSKSSYQQAAKLDPKDPRYYHALRRVGRRGLWGWFLQLFSSERRR